MFSILSTLFFACGEQSTSSNTEEAKSGTATAATPTPTSTQKTSSEVSDDTIVVTWNGKYDD